MKTRLTLRIGKGEETLLEPSCVKNWRDIACTYKRSDMSGVMREFTNKFEFAGEAADALLDEYIAKSVYADATVTVYTLEDDLTYLKRFECALDFSTLQQTEGLITISAVDNSTAAKIKAAKGTKYEFDTMPYNGQFAFDRVKMVEYADYEFTQGNSLDDGAIEIWLDASDPYGIVWLGNVENEVSVGGNVLYLDDQETEENGHLLEAYKAVKVKLEVEVVIDKRYGNGSGRNFEVAVVSRGGYTVYSKQNLFSFPGSWSIRNCGTYELPGELPTATAELYDANGYAIIKDEVWVISKSGDAYQWQNTGISPDEYFEHRYTASATIEVAKNRCVRIQTSSMSSDMDFLVARVKSSKFHFEWQSRGDELAIPYHTPQTVLRSLIDKMNLGNEIGGRISKHDPRLERTVLIGGEDIRGLAHPKFYTSFNEFCDWMEAVFGYTYYIDDSKQDMLSNWRRLTFGGFIGTPDYENEQDGGSVLVTNIKFSTTYGKFMALIDGEYYSVWNGSVNYNNPDTGHPYEEILYRLDGVLYRYADGELIEYNPIEIVFVHRSELFSSSATTRYITDAKEVEMSVQSSDIYSEVEVGYDSQDYDSVNGRDEFNFGNSYSTGCTVSEKKLSLMSKYRADCYGMEFTAHKRGKDTTDSTSDSNVFFVLLEEGGNHPDRTATVEGTLSDTVFNAAFNPMACVKANEGYIARQLEGMALAFASGTGNTEIAVDGVQMNTDIELGSRLAGVEEVQFTTSDLTTPGYDDKIVVTSNGVTYEGFLSEVEQRFAMEETARYKLILYKMYR